MSLGELRNWSRYFHDNVPPNPFYRLKIPYKTVAVVRFQIVLRDKFYIGPIILSLRDYLLANGLLKIHGRRHQRVL